MADSSSTPSVADTWGGWEHVYLDYLRRLGGRVRGAAVAGVSWAAVQARETEDPAFAEAVGIALEEYLDGLEQKLVEQAERRGNPVGYIVRLKAGRPAAYIERHAVQSVSLAVSALDPVEARALLRRMLADTTSATRGMLTRDTGALSLGTE